MSEPYRTEKLAGWGRIHPKSCRLFRPERLCDLRSIVADQDTPHCIARGLGRSYGDASVNENSGVAQMLRMNRMLDFDPTSGLLSCEAGVTLEEILAIFVPRGFFLPVTPGTKFVTVGGAIANDVHGKNHHRDGTFGQFVRSLDLLTGQGETLHCSPEENSDVFWATVGGVGLTGFILNAEIELQPIESAYVSVDYYKAVDLDDALSTMAASDQDYQYSVAWIDCLAKGNKLGRAVLMRGNHARTQELSIFQREAPLSLKMKKKHGVPFDFPGMALNPWSLKAFNTLLYAQYYTKPATVVDYDSYFYPLDSINDWNRMYGKQGFVQYQATFPKENVAGLVTVLERLSATKRASFLAVLKCFGEGNQGLLSHPMSGYTLNLDIPNRSGLFEFLAELDGILLDHGGRLYLAKDTAMAPESLAAMYPKLDEFRAIKERLDPEHRFSSTLARRLHLAPATQEASAE